MIDASAAGSDVTTDLHGSDVTTDLHLSSDEEEFIELQVGCGGSFRIYIIFCRFLSRSNYLSCRIPT